MISTSKQAIELSKNCGKRFINIRTNNEVVLVLVSNLYGIAPAFIPTAVYKSDPFDIIWSKPVEDFLKEYKME